MLALSRKEGEQVMIGNNIVITVVRIARGRVKLGIDAPRNVEVDRREVREEKQARVKH